MLSAFYACQLVNLDMIDKVLFTSEQLKRNKMVLRVTLGTASNVLVC